MSDRQATSGSLAAAPPASTRRSVGPLARALVYVAAATLGFVGLVTALVGDIIIAEGSAESDFPVAAGGASDLGQSDLGQVVLGELPAWAADARPDGEGPVNVDEAVQDLVFFTAAAADGRAATAELFTRAGFVDEYYRRWLIPDGERPMLVAIEVFRFRDAPSARDVHDAVSDLLRSASDPTRADAWREILAGGAAEIEFEPLEPAEPPDTAMLEAHVRDADQAMARGLTYELLTFHRGPHLTALTVVFPPEVDRDVGRARAVEVARLQYSRL